MGLIQKTAEKILWRIAERRAGVDSSPAPSQLDAVLWSEMRSSLENPQTPLNFPAEWLLDIFNGGRTDSGIRVSEMTALQVDAVLACVSIIANGVASLPLHVYERQIRDKRMAKQIATEHSLYDLLRAAPNEEMTSHTFRSVVMVHRLLWGNAYAEIQRDNAARIAALWPRNPARTRPVRLTHDARIEGTLYPRGTLVYHTSETLGDEISGQDDNQNRMAPERIILAEDLLHFPGLSLDGRLGQSTVYLARQIIGLALATEKHGAKFFGNGAVPRGILEVPGVLEPKAIETLRRSWQEAHGGENAQKTAVLEQGVKYTPIGADMEKSQFLATRKYQRSSIASIFNVPPHMIGEGEGSKSSVEQTSIEFLHYCIGPHLDSLEQEFKRKLFDDDFPGGKKFFAKFDTHQLLYPNSDSRAKFYTSGKTAGWLNTNDIRELEDLNPVDDGSGDIYWMPINMQDAANPLTAPHIGGAQNAYADTGLNPEKPMGGAPQNKTDAFKQPSPSAPKVSRSLTSIITRYSRIYYPMFKDATGRVQVRKEIDEAIFRRCFEPSLTAMVETLSAEFSQSESLAIPASEFAQEMRAYMEGMRSNLHGVAPELNETYAANEVRRAAETFAELVGRRYNPKHAEQPRHPDGTWHDGSTDFFIGRHGMTEDDIDGKWSGWRGVKLNAQGRQQVDETADKLKGCGIKRIISSNLLRTQETAQRISRALGNIPIDIDTRLSSLNIGIFAGMNEEENKDRLKIYIDNPDVPIPEGEAVNDYIKRVHEAIDAARMQNEATGPILVVTHSSGIAAYLCDMKSLEYSSCLLSPAGVLQLNGKKVQLIAGTYGEGDAA